MPARIDKGPGNAKTSASATCRSAIEAGQDGSVTGSAYAGVVRLCPGASSLALVTLLASCAAPAPRALAPDEWLVANEGATPGAAPPPTASPPIEQCSATEEGYDRWIEAFGRYALEQKVSEATVTRALAAAGYDPGVLELDRSQKAFKLSFEEFAAKRVTAARIARGRRFLAQHRDWFAVLVARFGVQAEVLVAIWGLETDFGVNVGSTPSLRALATLAYDCRRAARFRGELLSALRILDRGDLTLDEMTGAWAGELGQMQFLPSSYERFGVDFDGDGRVDMVSSSADALASTANYLAGHGWRAGEAYPPGSPNFDALREWNRSEIYRKTIVLLASKLAAR